MHPRERGVRQAINRGSLRFIGGALIEYCRPCQFISIGCPAEVTVLFKKEERSKVRWKAASLSSTKQSPERLTKVFKLLTDMLVQYLFSLNAVFDWWFSNTTWYFGYTEILHTYLTVVWQLFVVWNFTCSRFRANCLWPAWARYLRLADFTRIAE